MARRCTLTGKQTQFGHNVSHSNRKTNRRFLPNIQSVSLVSEALGSRVPLRIAVRTLRTVQRSGGPDAYLLKTSDAKLAPEGLRLKRRIKKALVRTRPRPAASG